MNALYLSEIKCLVIFACVLKWAKENYTHNEDRQNKQLMGAYVKGHGCIMLPDHGENHYSKVTRALCSQTGWWD